MRHSTIGLVLFISLIITGGCGDDAAAPVAPGGSLDVVASVEPASFTPGADVTVTVEVVNNTDSPVVYGMGSSTCQYLAVLRYGDVDRGMPVSRVCTPDEAVLSLQPGERRTESWTWTGEVVVDGAVEPLPPGLYELRGVAGTFMSEAVPVEVVE